MPPDLAGLGLPPTELARHIGWDIGAAGVTEAVSELLDAPAILCGTSRLVIDCNRQFSAKDLIPEVSDGTIVHGNLNLTDVQRAQRIDHYFAPYHDAVERLLEGRPGTVVVSIHSMTPTLHGVARPWQIALSSDHQRVLTERVLRALRAPGDAVVGDNQPYDMDPAVDYSTPFHAQRRGLEYVQVEFRQDEIAHATGQLQWATRFAKALLECDHVGS